MEALATVLERLQSQNISSNNLSAEKANEIRGLRLFHKALVNIDKEPTLIEEFFQLVGMADQARDKVPLHSSHVPKRKRVESNVVRLYFAFTRPMQHFSCNSKAC